MISPAGQTSIRAPGPTAARDGLADMAAVRAARARPMAERLEVALSMNAVVAELRAGVEAAARPQPRD